MDFKRTYGFDKKKAEEGVWVDIGEGGSLLLKKIGTLEYQQSLMDHTRKYQAKFRINRMTAEDMQEVMVLTLAESVLKGWKGMTEDGEEVPYTKTEAVFRLREYPDFRDQVQTLANDNSYFQDVDMNLEVDSKNLLTASNGLSTTEESENDSSLKNAMTAQE